LSYFLYCRAKQYKKYDKTFAYLRVEPTSPIQAMSPVNVLSCSLISSFKITRSWKKNIKSTIHCGIRKSESLFITWPLQSRHHSQLSCPVTLLVCLLSRRRSKSVYRRYDHAIPIVFNQNAWM
jgi:hypothetical protein